MYLEPTKGRKIPDYIEDKSAAQHLVNSLHDYYHRRGYHSVKVWLEPETMASGRRHWYIRSNIVFSVPE